MPRAPIVAAKLRRPSADPRSVRRTRLIDRLVSDDSAHWVVSGPAGFGKTLLLLDAVEASGQPSAWVTVDSRDIDPVRFWRHVIEASGGLGADVELAHRLLDDDDVGAAVDALHGALDVLELPHRLVFDDLHLATPDRTSPVVQALAAWLRRPPRTTTLAFTTRHDLELPVARLRLEGRVVEIGADDLAVDVDDAPTWFTGELESGLLGLDEAVRLVATVGGWPAGIRLARIAMHSGTPIDRLLDATRVAANLDGYLTSEVLDTLSPDTVEFVTDVSVLTELTADACAAVSGREDAAQQLASLVADQVFTAQIDTDPPTYRFHDLFRDLLLDRARARGPASWRELHVRAAAHAAALDDPDAIIHHAVAAGDHDQALRTIATHYVRFSNAGNIDTLWQWIHLVGPERVLGHRLISAMPAWMSLNRQRYDEIDPWIESIHLVDGLDQDHLDDFALQGNTIRSYRDRHLGELDRAVEHGLAAVEFARIAEPDDLAAPSAFAVLGCALALTGGNDVDRHLDRAIELGEAVGEDTAVVLAHGVRALLADTPEEADEHADRALAYCDDEAMERFHQPALAWIGRARAALERGRIGDAASAAGRARRLALANRDPAPEILAELLLARVDHLGGDHEAARAHLRKAETRLGSIAGSDWLRRQARETAAAIRFAAIDGPAPPGTVPLSDREMAVLRLLPHGLSRRELAEQLFVSENTVKTHLTSIRHKLGVPGRADIVTRARELELLDEG